MATRARATLDRELGKLQDGLLRLAEMVDAAIARSLQALSSRDVVLAREVVEGDQAVNALRFAIEEECLSLIATQQPAAGDLRAVLAAMNIVSDMERMAETCRGMLRRALDSYVARDVELAKAVAREDDLLDNLHNQIFRELLSFMVEDPGTTTRALYLLFTAHNLERIGDRVTNIAERVIFMASGELRELNPEPHDNATLQ